MNKAIKASIEVVVDFLVKNNDEQTKLDILKIVMVVKNSNFNQLLCMCIVHNETHHTIFPCQQLLGRIKINTVYIQILLLWYV